MARVDLNCDLGEGAGHDAELMPLITSANIACGGHAGDEATMRAAVALAVKHGVAIGAHPGFADRENFGRKEWSLSAAAVRELVREQVAALQTVAGAGGGKLTHVKLHGALYNMAARDANLAEAVAGAVREIDTGLVLFGLAGSRLIPAGIAAGLITAQEVFADRTYQPDGALTPRNRPEALLADPAQAAARVLRMVREGRVRATEGSDVLVRADTVCLHGDGPQAVAWARQLRAALAAAGVELRRPGS